MQSLSKADFANRRIAGRILKTAADNFVERPWGGTRLRAFKGYAAAPQKADPAGHGPGESFEISACDDDPEAARYPGRVRLPDGAWTALPQLVRDFAEPLLGEAWVRRYGRCVPLLPKFLNVRELLSVQGHPPGHTEAYVVVEADPAATIRIGFRHDMDPQQLRRELEAGRSEQRTLAALLGDDVNDPAVQCVLADGFAERDRAADAVLAALDAAGSKPLPAATRTEAATVLESLGRRYWRMLDAMNEIPLLPGQVIYNANPPRFAATRGGVPAAEVHALGNPARAEFIMLEVRRPGPTLRAWDHVRFPIRDIDVDGALEVFNLSATDPQEFMCVRTPLQQPGHCVSVDCEYFRIEHVEAGPGGTFVLQNDDAHCLHVLAGSAELETDIETTDLRAGESALVPIGVREYRGTAGGAGVHLVKVHLP